MCTRVSWNILSVYSCNDRGESADTLSKIVHSYTVAASSKILRMGKI